MSFDFPNAPTVGQAYSSYVWDGEKWVGGAQGSTVYVSDSAPAAPVGALWFESDTGILYVHYNDGNSTQWVAVVTPGVDAGAVRFDGAQTLTTMQQAMALSNAGATFLHGRLSFVSSTALKFAPYGGDCIRINGVIYRIPSAGIVGLANTGIWLNGTPGQILSANTVYLVTAFVNAGVVTAHFTTTVSHATSATAGNTGTEIATSNDNHTVIGLVRMNASSQFADSATQRFVRSWFNDPGVAVTVQAFGSSGAGGYIDVDPAHHNEFLIWAGEAVDTSWTGVTSSNTAATNTWTVIGFNGTPEPNEVVLSEANANYNMPMAVYAMKLGLAEGYNYAQGLGHVSGSIGSWIGTLTTRIRI